LIDNGGIQKYSLIVILCHCIRCYPFQWKIGFIRGNQSLFNGNLNIVGVCVVKWFSFR
jgi:hypothetical protein